MKYHISTSLNDDPVHYIPSHVIWEISLGTAVSARVYDMQFMKYPTIDVDIHTYPVTPGFRTYHMKYVFKKSVDIRHLNKNVITFITFHLSNIFPKSARQSRFINIALYLRLKSRTVQSKLLGWDNCWRKFTSMNNWIAIHVPYLLASHTVMSVSQM